MTSGAAGFSAATATSPAARASRATRHATSLFMPALRDRMPDDAAILIALDDSSPASAPRPPAQQVALDAVDAEVDAEDHGRGEEEAGHAAGGVEDALRLRHEVADAARRAHVLADDRADQREAD